MKYETIIGLEIHIQLKTKTKLFCSCPNDWLENKPNKNICPICLGHPGVLPVLNLEAVKKAILFGLAISAKINRISFFDRKNYFYPDLPKGYQITQYQKPIIENGHLEIGWGDKIKKIKIRRAHLEEDAAKSIHHSSGDSLIDFNRAGVPLLEIVTEPDINSAEEAKEFLKELRLLARYLGISEAEMEKGQMRCDANISLRPIGDKKMYPKTEIKNLNSFHAVEQALNFEIKRQKQLWEQKKPPKSQSTRGWDSKKKITFEQRSKEKESDYRYFPEPDLPILDLEELEKKELLNIDSLTKSLIELPRKKRERFIREYNLSYVNAKILTDNTFLANFFERVISELKAWIVSLETVEGTEKEIWEKNKKKIAKIVANWIINRLFALLKIKKIELNEINLTPENFAEFIIYIQERKITSTLAQKILEKMILENKDIDRVISEDSFTLDKSENIDIIIDEIIKENEQAVKDYKKGKVNAIQFLVGQAMKKLRGRGNPKEIEKIIKNKLK